MPIRELKKSVYMRTNEGLQEQPAGYQYESDVTGDNEFSRELVVATPVDIEESVRHLEEEDQKAVNDALDAADEERRLRDRYKELTGENAGGRMKLENLRNKVADLEAEEDGE